MGRLASEKAKRRALAYAAKHGDRPLNEIASYAGVTSRSLLRWRKDADFAAAFDAARRGERADDAPVDIETFIRSKEYLGLGVRVWPLVLDELKKINSGQYDLVILAGSLGAAKTYVSTLSLLYQLYRLLMIPNAHQSFGLDPASPIIVAVQNRTRKLAERNDFALARNLIMASPWFQQFAPHDQRIKSRVIFLKQRIELWPASGDAEDLLGMNLHSLILDEGNFFQRVEKSKRSVDGSTYDAAREAFEGALRRKQTRFPPGVGMFFVASSRRYRGQFTDQLEKEFGDDPRTYIYSHTSWSIHPEAYEGEPRFSVFTGDRHRPPRVLDRHEKVDVVDRHLVIEVPERHRRRFESDPVRSLQDLAGISTEISGGFFTDRVRLSQAASLDSSIVTTADVEQDATRLLGPGRITLQCPNSPRHFHGDLSLTADTTGLSCGYIERYNSEGLPEIATDFIARVHPPRVGQIEIDSVYRLIATLLQRGVPIVSCSFDGYASQDILQRVSRLGIAVGKLSADATAPGDPMAAYETLRAAISEGRFRFQNDAKLIDAMLMLQCDHERQRVDHLPNWTKDVSDAMACIAYQLTHRVKPYLLAGKVDGAERASAIAAPRLASTVTPIPSHGTGTDNHEATMALIRWCNGIGRADAR
jgi:hypothetical protein